MKDLYFEVGELSLNCLELRDVVWGAGDEFCLSIADIRVDFTLKSLLNRRINCVEIVRFETPVHLNMQNNPESRLLDHSLKVARKFRELHPRSNGFDRISDINIPDIKIQRASVEIRGYDGFERGILHLDGASGAESGKFTISGEFPMPDGKRVAFRGSSELTLSETSPALSAAFQGVFNLSQLTQASYSFVPSSVGFSGSAEVSLFENQPEWQFDMQLLSGEYSAAFGRLQVGARLSGETAFSGNRKKISGEGKVRLRDIAVSLSDVNGDECFYNSVQNAFFEFSLPETSPDDPDTISADCRIGLSNVCVRTGDFFLEEGALEIPFALAGDTTCVFSQTLFSWRSCAAEGIRLNPMGFIPSISNNHLRVKSGISVDGEPVEARIECDIPLDDPRAGAAFINIPEVKLTSDGAFGDLLEEKSGKRFDFNGRFAARAKLDALIPGSAITGCVSLRNAECSAENLKVSGVNFELPFVYDGIPESTGAPRLSIGSLEMGNLSFSNGDILFQLRGHVLFVEKAEIDWAEGGLRTYAVHLAFDGNILNEFVVYADRVDMGEVFMLINPLEAQMEGVLYGRFEVGLQNRKLNLSTGYLYSLPGQGGYLKVDDPENMEILLRRAGLRRDIKEIARALSDIDLSAMRLDLDPAADDNSSLKIRLVGQSNYEKRPAPIDLNLNIKGPLDEVLNLGIDMRRVLKR
ncbi:MAG: YdbH domain-containing protein [Kiritimatiellia bacterium]